MIEKTIDITKLDVNIIRRMATIPMLNEMRKHLKENIKDIARQSGDHDFQTWAANISDIDIEACLHLGFLESNFLEAICGVHDMSPITLIKKPHNAKDGQHRTTLN